MNLRATPLPCPRSKEGGARRTRAGKSAFSVAQVNTSPLTAHRRIDTAGNMTPLTIGPKTASVLVLVKQRDGAASASGQAAMTRLTAPSTSCVRLVVRGAPSVSFRLTTAKTPHWRKRGMTPVLTSMTSSTLKHSRESGCWEGIMS